MSFILMTSLLTCRHTVFRHFYLFKKFILFSNYKINFNKCLFVFSEIDYVCFDMLPRHHSIVRWRMGKYWPNDISNHSPNHAHSNCPLVHLTGKPYRLTEVEMAYPDYKMYMFRQACTWSSFTVDREDIAWTYKTFLCKFTNGMLERFHS